MRLSVCVITKNEEKNIATCLKSIQSIASEIIVVDTGSTDDTISIARKLGAKVYHFKWVDDFSKAKNHAISKSTGKWILFLDADEYLTEESLKHISPIIKIASNIQAQVITTLLSNYEKKGNRFLISSKANRLFKNHPNLYYVGAIHEAISYSGKGNYRSLDAADKIQIIHTGYSLEDRIEKNKGERNLKLLYKELEKEPDNGVLHFYISESLASTQNYENSLRHACKALLGDKLPEHLRSKNYRNMIYLMRDLNYPLIEILNTINIAIKKHPNFSDLYYALATFLKKDDRLFDAIEAYVQVLNNIGSAFKIQSAAIGYIKDVYASLAELYYKTDQISESIENFVKVLKLDRYDTHSLKMLLSILNKYEATKDIMEFLKKVYNYENLKDILVLLQASLQINSEVLSGEFFTLLNNGQKNRLHKESTYLKLLKGQYEDSVLQFKEIFLNTYEYETAVFCIVAAELANDKEVLEEIVDHVNQPLANIIRKIYNKSDVKTLDDNDEIDEVMNIIKQFIKLGHIEKVFYFLNFLPETKWNQIAELFFNFEKYELALELYNKYLEYEKDISSQELSKILNLMGESLYKLGNIELSVRFFEDSINLNPNDYKNYELILITLKKSNDYEKLQEIAANAGRLFPDSKHIRNHIKDEEVLRELDKLVENRDENVCKEMLFQSEAEKEDLDDNYCKSSLDIESNQKLKNKDLNSPIFVGGAGRSGTTLMRVMLNAHPNLCSGPEFKMLQSFMDNYNQLKSMNSILDSYSLNVDDINRIYAQFISSFFEKFRKESQATRIVEKTPHNVLIMRELIQIFPNAKFINVIRDGRDVATSLTKMSWCDFNGKPIWYVESIENAAKYWVQVVTKSIIDSQQFKDHIMVVHYEDLIKYPEKIMRNVLDFIGEPWSEQVLNHDQVKRTNEPIESSTFQVSKKIYKNATKKWEKDFTEKDKKIFREIAGDLLIRLGYEESLEW